MSQILCTTSTETNSNESNSNEKENEYTFINGFNLKAIKKNSNHEVWRHFGLLFKENKTVKPMERRILCKLCFNTEKIKR